MEGETVNRPGSGKVITPPLPQPHAALVRIILEARPPMKRSRICTLGWRGLKSASESNAAVFDSTHRKPKA